MSGLRKWNVKIFYHTFLTDNGMTTAVTHHRYFTLRPELPSCLIPVTRCRRDVVSLFYWRSSRSYGGKEWKRITGAAPNTDEAYNAPVLKLRIQPSWDARFCISRGFAPSIKQWLTQVETQYFASHKQPFRKPTRYNISHLIMLLFLGRRKILRLYKADAINKTVINPSRDAKSCVSQAIIPHTYALQYTTYKHVFIPRETQNLASLQGWRHQ